MEQDKKPVSNAIARTPAEFTLTPQWAQGLGLMAKEKYGSLRYVRSSTKRLVDQGEVPVNLLDFNEIVSDLVAIGYADLLAVVLAHLPPALIELVVTNNRISPMTSKGRESALKTLIEAVLLNSGHSASGKFSMLHFGEFQFTENEAVLLADGFKKTNSLQVLGFDNCSFAQKHPEVFKSVLQTNKSLKSLRLCNMPSLLVSLLEAFKGNKTLDHLELKGVQAGFELLASALKQNKTLVSLDCIYCNATDEQWAAIINGLQHHPTLGRLAVIGSSMNRQAAEAMAKMLVTVPTLTQFCLKSRLGEALVHLKDALGHIEVLEIASTDTSEDDTLTMLKVLEKNDNLTHLKWLNPEIGNAGANFIGNWIKKTTKLKCLSLQGMSGMCAQPVIDAMKFNQSLDELDLTKSCDMGALSLDSLMDNKHLSKLVLSFNRMDLAACAKIAPVLHKHSAIICVELNSCSIECDGLQKICEALEGPATIRSLSLGLNNFGPKGVELFFKEFKKNRGLVSLCLDPTGVIDHVFLPFLDIPEEVLAEGLQGHLSLIALDHRLYLNHAPKQSRQIDLWLHRNFTAQNPDVIKYLRGFMAQFAWRTMRFGDIGDVIWKYFVKDTDDGKKDGMFATVEALRAALAIRLVMLGSAEFNPSLEKAGLKATGSHDQKALSEPDAKRQKT